MHIHAHTYTHTIHTHTYILYFLILYYTIKLDPISGSQPTDLQNSPDVKSHKKSIQILYLTAYNLAASSFTG